MTSGKTWYKLMEGESFAEKKRGWFWLSYSSKTFLILFSSFCSFFDSFVDTFLYSFLIHLDDSYRRTGGIVRRWWEWLLQKLIKVSSREGEMKKKCERNDHKREVDNWWFWLRPFFSYYFLSDDYDHRHHHSPHDDRLYPDPLVQDNKRSDH